MRFAFRSPLVPVAVLASLVAGSLAACESRAGRTDPEFDFSKHSVPVEEILSGGPPKDGIPAIMEPVFVEASEADFLRDEDLVVGITLAGSAKAYPLRILNWHEVVNDTVAEQPVAVTYCPLTGSSLVFDRRAGGSLRSFGVSGRLYNSNVLMYDHQSGSLWSQLGESAVTGEQTGTALETVPSVSTTWHQWLRMHPDTLVLSPDTGHRRDYLHDPYGGYGSSQALPVFARGFSDVRLRPKDKVLGIVAGGVSRAYPLEQLRRHGDSLTETVGGRSITVGTYEGRDAGAYANWEEGPFRSVVAYWFAWTLFHPDTELWQPPAEPRNGAVADATSRAVVSEVESYWTGLSGFAVSDMGADGLNKKGLFVVKGHVTNVSSQALHHVRLRFELLDTEGKVVYYEEGFNRGAEPLLDARPYGGDLAVEDTQVKSIRPGEHDTFRMAFIGEEVPAFASRRVVVLEAE